VQSVWTDVADLDGLRRSTEQARDGGFFGRSVIHPAQVPVVNEVFTPTAAQIRAARDLIDALAATERDGRAAFLDHAGRFVDPAVIEGARWTLAVAARLDQEFDQEEAQ
jgi:citrate lyase subunit beta/citryl-CoA lyase